VADPMKIRAVAKADQIQVKILMAHEEETGLRKGPDGVIVPAHFISNVSVRYADREVLRAQWGPAIAKNPFMQFTFRGAVAGAQLTVTWVDNRGDSRTDQVTVA
jgi:sulfur-oxidizing protein SoxZ